MHSILRPLAMSIPRENMTSQKMIPYQFLDLHKLNKIMSLSGSITNDSWICTLNTSGLPFQSYYLSITYEPGVYTRTMGWPRCYPFWNGSAQSMHPGLHRSHTT
jgi:hypothetical protein